MEEYKHTHTHTHTHTHKTHTHTHTQSQAATHERWLVRCSPDNPGFSRSNQRQIRTQHCYGDNITGLGTKMERFCAFQQTFCAFQQTFCAFW